MAKHAVVNQPTARPVAKILAVIGGWLGSAAGATVLAAVSDSVSKEAAWGAFVAGGLAALSGYLKRSRSTEA